MGGASWVGPAWPCCTTTSPQETRGEGDEDGRGGDQHRRSACFWLTRSNTLRTSSCCVATTSVPPSTGYMDSMTSASGGTTSSCGKLSPTASTASPLQP